jgi:hypothetical protein
LPAFIAETAADHIDATGGVSNGEPIGGRAKSD